MVPAHKISAYEHLKEVLVSPFRLEEDVLSSIPGGLIMGSGRGSLYSHWTSLDKLDIGECVSEYVGSFIRTPGLSKWAK